MISKKFIYIDETYGWRKTCYKNETLWIKGIIYNYSDLIILKKLISINESDLKKFFKNIEGHFAIIFRFIIRPLAKFFFVFGKKSSWHKFKRRYILYFTDVLCGMGVKKYKDIALDKRGFRNFLSLHTENYLKKYKIKL